MYENETNSNAVNEEAQAQANEETQTPANEEQKMPYFDYTPKASEVTPETIEAKSKKVRKAKREKKGKDVEGRKQMGPVKKLALCVAMGLCFGACAGVSFWGVQKLIGGKEPVAVETNAQAGEKNELPANAIERDKDYPTTQITYVQDDISDMVEEAMPAMVSIVNNFTTTYSNFWGQNFQEENVASGSGIIVGETKDELLIATNNHVIEDANKLEVTFIDGSVSVAVVKGTDPDMDLAVIAVPLKDISAETLDAITVATLGDSDNLKLGEPVVAIGNALGYGQSVTNGIVSALNRDIEITDGNKGTFIQTNAAINPGNSGGALLNIKGEVIGINSSKIGGSTIEGMGYAIPISSASPILSELMERQTRVKVEADEIGYMGITMQAITSDIAEAYGMPKGVFVREVEEGSPADLAGLMKGDIIVKFDGQKVSTNTDIQEGISYFRAGDTVKVTVKRAIGGTEYDNIDIDIVLGSRPVSE